MKKIAILLTTAALAVGSLPLASTATAHETAKKSKMDESALKRISTSPGDQANLGGMVKSTTAVRSPADRLEEYFIRISFDDGQSAILNLGAVDVSRIPRIYEGDIFRSSGTVETVEDVLTLDVDRMWINGEKVQSYGFNY